MKAPPPDDPASNIELPSPNLAAQDLADTPTDKAKKELDIAVQKRTAELQNLNHQLQLELAEAKQVEETLRQREEQFRLLTENASEIISILDADGIIRYESPAVERVLGYKPEALTGRSTFEFVHPDDVSEVRRIFGEEIQKLEASPVVEYRFQHKDGSWRVLRSVASNWRDHPAIAGVVVNSRDITERKQAEEELQGHMQRVNLAHQQAIIYAKELNEKIAEHKRAELALAEERALLAQRVTERTAELSAANAELARVARAKDEFLASMSHELRTPLNAILGLTEALQEQTRGPLNERQLKSLRTIEESGRHLLALINDILDLSKIEAGKLELQLDRVSLEAVCQASLQFIKEAAAKKKIDVSFTLDTGEATMRADTRRLKQILVNLLSNAVKFTPVGGQVGLVVTGETERQVITFCIWDTGIGIAPEDLPRLFKPFVQVDSSLSRQHEGTGLGLALVTRLVELHGGSLTVESEPSQGSRFIVSLPWQESFEITQKLEPAETLLDNFSFRRVLVIEDSAMVIEQITRYLQEFNIQTVAHS
ncbi:MAG: PAS domain-containing sensor histidine kinase, partial [Chloroflexi bacterium]|nr:PAS domain-containing sensor histidine kinase [Chloroflexota bacterium]